MSQLNPSLLPNLPAGRLVGQQDARVARAAVSAAAGDEAEVRAGIVLAGIGGSAKTINFRGNIQLSTDLG